MASAIGAGTDLPECRVPAEMEHIDLAKAALEWEEILVSLAAGSNVSAAVAAGNRAAQDTGAAHRWNFKGDGSVDLFTPRP